MHPPSGERQQELNPMTMTKPSARERYMHTYTFFCADYLCTSYLHGYVNLASVRIMRLYICPSVRVFPFGICMYICMCVLTHAPLVRAPAVAFYSFTTSTVSSISIKFTTATCAVHPLSIYLYSSDLSFCRFFCLSFLSVGLSAYLA